MRKLLTILGVLASVVVGAVVSMFWLFLVIGMACVMGVKELIDNKTVK